MRQLMSTILVVSLLTGSALAGVKEDVTALGGIAMGSRIHAASGKSAEQVMKSFFEKEYGDYGPQHKEYDSIEYSDETGYGFISFESALKMGNFAITTLEYSLENGVEEDEEVALKKQINEMEKKWDGLIRKLHKQGMRFSYTGNGPGHSGISFVEMLVIDPKDQKVYQVCLSVGGTR